MALYFESLNSLIFEGYLSLELVRELEKNACSELHLPTSFRSRYRVRHR